MTEQNMSAEGTIISEEQTRETTVELDEKGVEIIGSVVRGMMAPIMESIGKMLKNNTEALNQIAAAQQVTSDRLEALEKQVRLNTPVTGTQAKYLNDAMRARARMILEGKGEGLSADRKAMTKLTAAIRKKVLARYGIGGIREIPKHEYTVAMSQVETWSDPLTVMDIVREARSRNEQ